MLSHRILPCDNFILTAFHLYLLFVVLENRSFVFEVRMRSFLWFNLIHPDVGILKQINFKQIKYRNHYKNPLLQFSWKYRKLQFPFRKILQLKFDEKIKTKMSIENQNFNRLLEIHGKMPIVSKKFRPIFWIQWENVGWKLKPLTTKTWMHSLNVMGKRGKSRSSPPIIAIDRSN